MTHDKDVAEDVVRHLLERTRDGSITWSATVDHQKVGTFNRQTFVLQREMDDFLDLLVKDVAGRTLWTTTSFRDESDDEPKPVDVEEVPDPLLKELEGTVQVQLEQNHRQRMQNTLEALTAV